MVSAPRDGLRGYAICTSPRSGSNFLCQHLTSTGVLGYPLEYFNWRGRRFFDDPNFPDDVAGQVEKILSMGMTPNRIYGLKIFAHQHDWISREIRWLDALPDLRFVFLSRRDLLGQAISWTRALQTGQYRSTQPANGALTFDAEMIQRQLDAIVREKARWELFFARTRIEPVKLEYESVVADPRDAIRQIAQLMNVRLEREPDGPAVSIHRQRDATTSEWADRFVAERGNPNILDAL